MDHFETHLATSDSPLMDDYLVLLTHAQQPPIGLSDVIGYGLGWLRWGVDLDYVRRGGDGDDLSDLSGGCDSSVAGSNGHITPVIAVIADPPAPSYPETVWVLWNGIWLGVVGVLGVD